MNIKYPLWINTTGTLTMTFRRH